MAYRQPRIPEGTEKGGAVKALTLFLKDFALEAWAANNRRKREIEEIKKRIEALEESMR